MDKYSIYIELVSEMIFGSGMAIPGYIDLDVLHDEYGLPYFKGKTFKGKLREEVESIIENIGGFNKTLAESLKIECINMFGNEGKENPLTIKFSDCTLGEDIINSIRYGIKEKIFTSDEVLNSMTSIRSFTSINETGVASDGSLRQFRVINKGFTFICQLYVEKPLSDISLAILSAAVSSLRHLGTMESRGKGEVICSLYRNGKDITKEYIEFFKKKVIK